MMDRLPPWSSPAEDLEHRLRIARAVARARAAEAFTRTDFLDDARPGWVPRRLWVRLMGRAYIRALAKDFVDAVKRARDDPATGWGGLVRDD